MSRRRRAEKREHTPDPRYNSTLVSHLINVIMLDGKKSIAQKIVYGAFEKVSENLGKGDPIDLKLEVKSRRVGGTTYQVPLEIGFDRQQSLAFRWLVTAARSRRGSMHENLAAEITDAYNNTGSVVKKKDDTHRMAQANRAFAHLRW